MPVPRVETLTENVDYELELAPAEARALEDLGRQLRSNRAWWGAELFEDPNVSDRRSVIRCQRLREDRWRVRVVDAVGVIAINQLQLVIEPKIPLPHLIYLLEASSC